MRSWKTSFTALGLLLSLLSPISASAVYKGESALGDEKVLTLASSKDSRSQFCSMALLTERIVVTAGHCMAGDQTEGGKLRFDTSTLWVTQPGVDMLTDLTSTRVKVNKVILVPGYENYWIPERNDRRTQRDDIAFLFLEKPLKTSYIIPIATAEEVASLKNSGGLVTHYGYGLQDQGKIDQKPYKLTLSVFAAMDNYLDANKTIFTREDGRALCPGDSGGPWYSNFNGITKIVAVTVAASGCRGSADPRGSTLGTLIFPYLELMKSEWEKFLSEENALKSARLESEAQKLQAEEELVKKIAKGKADGKYIQDTAVCHSRGVNAILQRNSESGWVDFEKLGGWIDEKNCPITHPVQPWNIVELGVAAELRWKIWVAGVFEAFTPAIKWSPKASPIVTPAPAPTTPVVKQSPAVKKTITCLKGRIVKKLIGINPKCPTGYKLKK